MVLSPTLIGVTLLMSLLGRAIGILPRSFAANGYRDLEHDDYKEDDFMCDWQETITKTSEAMAASALQV